VAKLERSNNYSYNNDVGDGDDVMVAKQHTP
jgi:hypothetical protein